MASSSRVSHARHLADRWFRGWGAATLVALAAAALLLASGREGWRVPFVLAHLAALLALAPLGLVLLVTALAEGARATGSPARAPVAVVRRYRLVAALLALVVVTVAVSLANFEGGTRWLRAAANLATIAIVLLLVARYLRAAGRYEA